MVAQLETPSLNFASTLPYTVEGLVQIFTCTHRTFFTSVMAQALCIAGHGTPVLIVQFLKGGINQGYQHPIKLGQYLDWIRSDLPQCINTPHLDEAQLQSLRDLWDYTKNVILKGDYSLVVLDELSVAINFGLIPESEVLCLLEKRPRHVDLILTGPEMPHSLLEQADQITEIRRSHRPFIADNAYLVDS